MDVPTLLLTRAVRRMPADRGDWGAAMLAELAQLQHPATRWRFALGCTRVALFPPRQGRLMNNMIKTIISNPRAAALIGLLSIMPFVLLNTIVANRIDFSDEPFWDGSMTPETRPGRLKTIADTRAWARAFFDGTVRGDWADLKRLVSEANKSQPEVTVHVFGRMWP
jgi:hypothetical protein